MGPRVPGPQVLGLRLLGLSLLGLLGAGCIEPAPLAGAPCPCTADFVCCPSLELCLRPTATCPGAERPDLDGGGEAGPGEAGLTDQGPSDQNPADQDPADLAPQDQDPTDQRPDAVGDAAQAARLLDFSPTAGRHTGGETLQVRFDRPLTALTVHLGGRPCAPVALAGAEASCPTPHGAEDVAWLDLEVAGTTADGAFAERRPAAFHARLPLLADVSEAAGVGFPTYGITVLAFDADGDARPDLWFARGDSGRSATANILFLNRSTPEALRFVDAADAPIVRALGRVFALLGADFDGDGRVDLLTTTHRGNFPAQALLRLAAGRPPAGGQPAFAAAEDLPLPGQGLEELRPALLDVDGDGRPDVVGHLDDRAAGADPARQWQVFLNTAEGWRAAPERVVFDAARQAAAPRIDDLAVLDHDGDGRPDLAACGDALWLFTARDGRLEDESQALGLGDPTVGAEALAVPCQDVDAVDIDLDGRPDLAWVPANRFESTAPVNVRTGVVVLRNTPGGFEPLRLPEPPGADCPSPRVSGAWFPAGIGSMLWFDADLDGDPDLLLPFPFARCIRGALLYRNQAVEGAPGTFTVESVDLGWPQTAPTGAVAVDLDGDGDLEVVLGAWGAGDRGRVLRNHTVENAASAPGALGPESPHWLRISVRTAAGAPAVAWRVAVDLDGPAEAPDFAPGPGRRVDLHPGATARDGQSLGPAVVGLGAAPPPYAVRVWLADGTVLEQTVGESRVEVVFGR